MSFFFILKLSRTKKSVNSIIRKNENTLKKKKKKVLANDTLEIEMCFWNMGGGCVHAKASCQVAKLVLTLREHIISPQATDPERP